MIDETYLSTIIDTSRPHVPCMYDYYLGGQYNSTVDRAAAQKALDAVPTISLMARMNRGFLRRVVRFMARQGVRQFLDIGSGLPTNGNTHEIAQEVLGEANARVVYVDHEEIVKTLGSEILAKDENSAVVIESCLHPQEILDHPDVRQLIDFSQAVGILMISLLHFFSDAQLPVIIDPIRNAACSRSYFAASQFYTPEDGKFRYDEDKGEQVAEQYRAASTNTYGRTEQEIVNKIFKRDGWEMEEPGLANVGAWRVDDGDKVEGDPDDCYILGGLAKKM
ncbi:DUF574-domain-containing protein [Rhizodiscina lignyota]|uniref:DUF574-domain-containing protein n=1 Tax=Rhizodiscina lignyota TaxID=1504668 RepID=A0A9P4M4Q6_9PEZI|nr:DUF574-domain-containing protein [Rhizodiscina lignyota]